MKKRYIVFGIIAFFFIVGWSGTGWKGGGTDYGDQDIINVGNIALDSLSSDSDTTINITLGSDAGDDFTVDTTKLVVEGDSGNVGIGTATPGGLLGIGTSGAYVTQATTNLVFYDAAYGATRTLTQLAAAGTGYWTETGADVSYSAGNVGINVVSPTTTHAINGGQACKKTNVADAAYGTSAITSDYIVAWTSISAARAAVISTEDEDSGTATLPRVMIFKDQTGSTASYNITISLESGGSIDGAATYILNKPYQFVVLEIDGTNAWTIGGN